MLSGPGEKPADKPKVIPALKKMSMSALLIQSFHQNCFGRGDMVFDAAIRQDYTHYLFISILPPIPASYVNSGLFQSFSGKNGRPDSRLPAILRMQELRLRFIRN